MRIGIDLMGGDFAPEVTVAGAIAACHRLPVDDELVMIGNIEIIRQELKKINTDGLHFSLVHASEIIEMGDNPSKAFQRKPDSSIAVGFNLLNSGKIDGFASAGSTGAMLVGSMYTVKSIPGIIRPCISTLLPKENGGNAILLDVGINPDCRPEVLYQYGVLGSIYSESVQNIANPRVGLLNIGAEEEKGSLLTKATYEMMKGSKDFNFIGNVEGTDLFGDRADVVVTDGFTGNVLLKSAESIYSLIRKRKIDDSYFEKFNFENYGGTPVLGINAPVVIGHGHSNQTAIMNMIILTKHVIEARITEKIIKALSK
ncbi:MAG: phosphate acyltransferase PlsX [Bacteroidia bacterium]|nr:phosphate acyltransferase PlsX [Bacteroidia bacterium]